MRIVNFTHDSITSVMSCFPIVNFLYFSNNIPGIICIWCFCFTVDVMLGFVQIIEISWSDYYSGFKVIEAVYYSWKLQITLRKL